MEKVYLGLGANLGNPRDSVLKAIALLKKLNGVENVRSSPLYQTKPVSPIPQPDFINAVVELETNLNPFELLKETQEVEKKLGKIPKERDEPRPIDIDILLFGEMNIDHKHLQIPHPRMFQREFVLRPLVDLIFC